MTDTHHHGYARLLDDFGQELALADGRRAIGRRKRWRVTGGGLLLAGLAATILFLAGLGSGGQLDLVSQAKAALTPAGEIVHLVTTTHIEARGGTEVGPSSTTEQWSTADPLRWRVATSVPTPTRTPGGKPVGKLDGLVTGPMQFAYADGTEEEYFERPNTLDITTGFSAAGPRGTPSGPLGVDPVVEVRAMLAAGRLRDAGRATVRGREVRRLVGEEPRGGNPSWPVEYDIDPQTFAPVRVSIEFAHASRPAGSGTPVIVLDVDTYQLIPLTAGSAALLKVHPRGNPTVVRHRAAEPGHHFARVPAVGG